MEWTRGAPRKGCRGRRGLGVLTKGRPVCVGVGFGFMEGAKRRKKNRAARVLPIRVEIEASQPLFRILCLILSEDKLVTNGVAGNRRKRTRIIYSCFLYRR